MEYVNFFIKSIPHPNSGHHFFWCLYGFGVELLFLVAYNDISATRLILVLDWNEFI